MVAAQTHIAQVSRRIAAGKIWERMSLSVRDHIWGRTLRLSRLPSPARRLSLLTTTFPPLHMLTQGAVDIGLIALGFRRMILKPSHHVRIDA